MAFRYRPGNGDIFADAIPYYWNGEYHVFYLRGKGNDNRWPRWKTCWAHLKSRDLVHWEELPNALEIGEQRFPDGGACYTGCVFYKDGQFHIMYAGYNPGHPEGREQILHAVSSDLIHFTKDPGYPKVIEPDGVIYRKMNDWRDPNVYWDEEEKKFWMLITGNTGDESIPYSRSGVTALVKSDDFVHWSPAEPIYAPLGYPALEVNEIFRMEDWWYLMFTNYAGHTEYRMSRSKTGPWIRPRFPELDLSTHFYGGKGVWADNRRMLFGWCGTLLDGIEDPFVQWGGDMLTPRELTQGEDGELCVSYPKEYKQCSQETKLVLRPIYGQWEIRGDSCSCSSMSGFAAAVIEDTAGDFTLKLHMEALEGYGRIGVALHCAEDLGECYYIDLDTGKKQLEILQFRYSNESQSVEDKVPGLDKPIMITGTGNLPLQDLFIAKKGEIAEIFIDGKTAVTFRCGQIPAGNAALFAENVSARFSGIVLRHLMDI